MKKILFNNQLLQNPYRRIVSVIEITSDTGTVTEAERGAMYIIERIANVVSEPTQFYIVKKENDKTGEYEFRYEVHNTSFAVNGISVCKITRVNYYRLKITEKKIGKGQEVEHGKS